MPKSPPLNSCDFEQKLDNSIDALKSYVELANTLASELGKLHVEQEKLRGHMQGHATQLVHVDSRKDCPKVGSSGTAASTRCPEALQDAKDEWRNFAAKLTSVDTMQPAPLKEPADTLPVEACFVDASHARPLPTEWLPEIPEITSENNDKSFSTVAQQAPAPTPSTASSLDKVSNDSPKSELTKFGDEEKASHDKASDESPVPDSPRSPMSPMSPNMRRLRRSLTSGGSLDEALGRAGVRLARTSRWVVNPEQSPALQKWDLITVCSLIFVAVVCPVQISMTECSFECPLLFIFNIAIDLVFFVDLVLQFFLMYPKKTNFGYVLECKHKQIVRNYLKTWFAIDVISLAPIDLISVFTSSSALAQTKAVKSIRLVRLLKLARILKASRLLRRLEVRMSFTYQRLELVKFFMLLAALMHWMACLWALSLKLVEDNAGVPRWVDIFDEVEANVVLKTKDSIWKLYIACFYFTSYTITSVGYGDIGPQNIIERMICTVMVLVSGVSWAMVLGQVVSIVGTMDVDDQQFKKKMDELNLMMEDRQLPTMLRRRLRSFLISKKLVQRHKRQMQIVESMSPGLQGEVTMEMNRMWLSKVSLLNEICEYANSSEARPVADVLHAFIYDVARSMQYLTFAQREQFGTSQTLYIVSQGIVNRPGDRLYQSGTAWGQDFLLTNRSLQKSHRCVCMTFVAVMTISREDFMVIVDKYATQCPEIQHRVRRSVCWLAVQRGIMREAQARREKGQQVPLKL